MPGTTDQTLDLIKAATPQPDAVLKGYTQATGLVAYDLEPAAKLLYPVLTPLRNRIPRVKGNGGTATNWKAITGVNTGNMRAGVSEGNRGGVIGIARADYTAAYRGLGLEDWVSFEADDAAQGFDDVRSLAQLNLLRSTMIQEERTILGGNTSIALGTTPTPTVVGSTSGGSLATGTLSVICVALTAVAMREATVAGGITLGINRTNIDGSVDFVAGGHAIKSAAGSAALTGPTASATASASAVNGAFGYAWFWGAAGSEVLGAITSLNTVTIKATATGTQAATAVGAGVDAGDQSRDTLVFDGILTQITAPGSGAQIDVAPTLAGVGTPFTSDGAGGINEIEAMFARFWAASRLSPDEMHVSGATLLALNKLIVANGGAPLIRFQMGNGGGELQAGTVAASYLNKITNTTVKFVVHPDLADGVILYFSNGIPYALNGVQNILQMKMRREYYAREWPITRRRYEYGVYCDGLLQNYFPPAFGISCNYRV